MCTQMPIRHNRTCLNTFYMYNIYHGCGMQFERFNSLIEVLSKTMWHHLHTYITYDFWGYVCGGNGVNVHPDAHPSQQNMLKHLLHV
jgi:hypothetical protein